MRGIRIADPLDLAPALEGIETAIRDLIAEEDKIAAEAQESREARDLEAQEGMAKWAEWMFYATAATVALSLAALFAIIRTLHHTRRAADSAEMVAADTRAIGQAQVRAYIHCKGANFKITKQDIQITLELENIGQSPAINVTARGEVTFNQVGGLRDLPRVLAWKNSTESEVGFEPIITGASKSESIFYLKDMNFEKEEWDGGAR